VVFDNGIVRLETKCRSLPHSTRSAVFIHLAKVLSCEKETLIKRAKRMVLAQHDEKLRQPIALLKEGADLSFLANIITYVCCSSCQNGRTTVQL